MRSSVTSDQAPQSSAADHAQIDPFNGVPVQTEGELLQARQHGPGSPSCHAANPADQEFQTVVGVPSPATTVTTWRQARHTLGWSSRGCRLPAAWALAY